MTGHIVQINISPGGLPKRPIREGNITPAGLEWDGWAHPGIHGGPEKAILIVAAETVDELKARGYPVFYGAMGENLTTRGLNPRQFRTGQQFRAGSALLELTRMRVPCSSMDIYGTALKHEIYNDRIKAGDLNAPAWGMSGFYARVLEPGFVGPDARIALVSMPA